MAEPSPTSSGGGLIVEERGYYDTGIPGIVTFLLMIK